MKSSELGSILRSLNGHWYGEFGFPQSTKVILNTNYEANGNKFNPNLAQKTGWLVVIFDDIYTTADADTNGKSVVPEGQKYLSYDMRPTSTQWMKEAGTNVDPDKYQEVILPDGGKVNIHDLFEIVNDSEGHPVKTMVGSAIAIYEVAYTSADDSTSGGTH